MFNSFFPKPKLFFSSMVIWSLGCVLFWFFVAKGGGEALSLGGFFGYGFPEALGADAEDAAKAAFAEATSEAGEFWFYQFFLLTIVLFCGFWMWHAPHPWQRWSVVGSALVFFVNWFLVQVAVMINNWYGEFYNLIQKALGDSTSVSASEYYSQITTILVIVMIAITVRVVYAFFVSHFVFRWRTAMNDHYMTKWDRLRRIEGASQRVQEDTQKFADITESLGVNLLDSVMTLIAFLPLLWRLSANVTHLPIIGEVSQGLVFVAIIWSILGTAILALVGIKLPGLYFDRQKEEAAYRKELVYGEDDDERAQPPSVGQLFGNVRKIYFRLYFHYLYFNVVRYGYLQFGNLVPFIALGPTIVTGAITLGVMQQILNAFNQVENSFQFLVNSWTTIVELLSIHKRLKAFEQSIENLPLGEGEQPALAD